MFRVKANEGFIVQILLDTATNEQEACYKSLEGRKDPIMQQVRDFANNAYTANKIVAHIFLGIYAS